jgi:NADPH:quinone reductase-like Zn-dependent oxidoreductase
MKQLGADRAIDYTKTDFRAGPDAYDMVFDCVGNAPHAMCARVLRGRRVHVTTMPGLGTFLRMFVNPLFRTKVFGIITKGNGEALAFIKSLVDDGKLQPVVDKVFPFADVAAAQEYSKSGSSRGKIVLQVR